MKKSVIYILVFIISTGFLSSCKKFLAETSRDEIRPSTTADLTSLMNGTAYPYQTPMDMYLDLLTDDIECHGLPFLPNTTTPNTAYSSYLDNGSPLFSWNPSMFDVTLQFDQDSWQIYYKKINGCNLIMDYLSKVTGPEKDKNAMLGQVLFLRAFYYLKLVNIYGQPYNLNPATNLGVPLILSSIVSDARPLRNTVAEVYAQIETDLLKSAQLLKDNYVPANVFRVGHITAYALLSRVYLYMGNYDKAIQNATDVITVKPYFTDLKTLLSPTGGLSATGQIYDVSSSPELIWVYGQNPKNTFLYYPQANSFSVFPPFTVSQNLYNLYDPGAGYLSTTNKGDLRAYLYFSKYTNTPVSGTLPYPGRGAKIGQSQLYGDRGIRLSEMYLNRAEAKIRRAQGTDLTDALADLNTLRINRYDTRTVAYVPVNITDPAALFTFCQNERRKELCLEEGHRWFDIRRWGLPVTHTLIDANGQSTNYTLTGLQYALPIPYTAINNNYNLVQNPR